MAPERPVPEHWGVPMGAAENAKAVRAAYEAFLRDDIEPMMALMADDVEWINYEDTPFAGEYRGKDGIKEYLATMDDIDFHGMEIESVLSEDDRVIGVLDVDYSVKATGERAGGLTVHVFDFDGAKVERIREVAASYASAWED